MTDTTPAGHVAEPSTSDTGPRPATAGLAGAIDAGLRALGDLRRPGCGVADDLERTLRTAVMDHQPRDVPGLTRSGLDEVTVAIRVACAHLAAGNLPEARLALVGAQDALPLQHRGPEAGAVAERARTRSEAQRRGLDARASIDRAAGVLAGHADTSPTQARAALYTYAERHGFTVTGVAGDVVAGRVDPGAVMPRSSIPTRRPVRVR